MKLLREFVTVDSPSMYIEEAAVREIAIRSLSKLYSCLLQLVAKEVDCNTRSLAIENSELVIE